MKQTTAAALFALAAAPLPLCAQGQSIPGPLCVGYSCTGSEPLLLGTQLKLKDETTALLFEDVSTLAGFAGADWRLKANEPGSGGASFFAIEDVESGSPVFMVADGARPHALHLDSAGHAGFGTALPGATLHMVSGAGPALRFEQDGSGGNTPQAWQLTGSESGFRLHDLTSGGTPLVIEPGAAPGESVTIDAAARMGLGTATPAAPLHLLRSDGSAALLIEETESTQTARPLLNLVNHGRPDIIMANTATGGEWAFGAGTNFVLKTGTVGSLDGEKTRHLRLYGATGNLEITGQIITGGPACTGGCDAVFSESYALPSISEHAAEMFALGHLPAIGPTLPGQPVNISEQYGRLLNEVEHAHIYIADQETRLAAQAARIAALEETVARLSADPE